MNRFKVLTATSVCVLAHWAGSACADAVTDWNEITVAAVTVGRPGPIGSLDIALVQLAVHDAVQAIDRRFEPYHVEIRAAKGSRSAAAAAAAHDVLVGLYPAQAGSLDASYHDYLANNGLTGDPGIKVGQKVAAEFLPLRRANPDPLPPPFVGGTDPGVWRPTDSFLGTPPGPPAPFSPMFAPWLGTMDPFTLTSPRRFRSPPPPALTSERYQRDYDEVKALGALVGSTRTPEQTDIAYFYTDNFFAQWNRALRAISSKHVHRIGDSARLFALANMATADAVITAWDSKKHYTFWRPLTAIREGDERWQSAHGRRPGLAAAREHAELSGLHLRREQRHWRDDTHACALLRHGPDDVRSNVTLAARGQQDAGLRALLGRRARCGRCASLSRVPFPIRGYGRTYAGHARRGLDVQSLPPAAR